MHRIVLTAFKVIGISLIMMMVFDVSLVMLDSISVHTKINASQSLLYNEISRHNYLPEDARDLFVNQLNNTVERSSVARSVSHNLNSLGPENVKDYGDTQEVRIAVTMSPRIFVFNNSPLAEDDSLLQRRGVSYELSYEFEVPCLRYIR